jgi:two-component system CAI-1 autoinducer sensor kinase/phosphatase CqsS
MLFGHMAFWFVGAALLPQPYENLPLRLVAAALGLVLVTGAVSKYPNDRFAGRLFMAVCWFELPLFFSWMYLCNGASPAWLASVAAMILTYYFVTDWRIATGGLVSGAAVAWLVFDAAGPAAAPLAPQLFWTHFVVLAACVGMGLVLGMTSANLRRERLACTAATMGIMAHELRTPLATMALIGDAVRGAASECAPEGDARLEQLAMRLHALVRNMNHQIDMQVTNVRLARPPARAETVSAEELVRSAVANYPFRSSREKECVRVNVQRDFRFRGSHPLFTQVIDNLVKNALRALVAGSAPLRPGDVTLEVGIHGDRGRIVIADRGTGIAPESMPRIFEPFFSTSRGTGHGLGLAFCRQVVQSAHGSIRVRSAPGLGAVFTVELPALRRD